MVFERLRLFVSAWGRASVSSDLRCGRRGDDIANEVAYLAGLGGDLLQKLDPYYLVPLPGARERRAEAAVTSLVADRLHFEGKFAHWPVADF